MTKLNYLFCKRNYCEKKFEVRECLSGLRYGNFATAVDGAGSALGPAPRTWHPAPLTRFLPLRTAERDHNAFLRRIGFRRLAEIRMESEAEDGRREIASGLHRGGEMLKPFRDRESHFSTILFLARRRTAGSGETQASCYLSSVEIFDLLFQRFHFKTGEEPAGEAGRI